MPVINTNISANKALSYLNNNSSLSSAVSKIASGSRIVKASDDAAGLAVGTRIQGDTAVFSQSGINASFVTSAFQRADGSASQIGDIMQRMKALATESTSSTVTQNERSYLQEEFDQLHNEINDIVKTTKAGDKQLLDGSYSDTVIIGVSQNDKISFKIGNFSTAGLGVDNLNITNSEDAQTALTALNQATDTVTSQRAEIGATISRFEYQSQTISPPIENTGAANSNIIDADMAAASSSLSRADVKTQAAIAVLSQANKMPQELLSLLR